MHGPKWIAPSLVADQRERRVQEAQSHVCPPPSKCAHKIGQWRAVKELEVFLPELVSRGTGVAGLFLYGSMRGGE